MAGTMFTVTNRQALPARKERHFLPTARWTRLVAEKWPGSLVWRAVGLHQQVCTRIVAAQCHTIGLANSHEFFVSRIATPISKKVLYARRNTTPRFKHPYPHGLGRLACKLSVPACAGAGGVYRGHGHQQRLLGQ